MPLVGAHYEGEEARKIRALTKRKVIGAIIRAVNAMGSAGQDIRVLGSLSSASNRLQSGQKFVVAVPSEPKTSRCRVLGTDNLAHSGMQYEWVFLLQMSGGKVGDKTTGDEVVANDDVLVDAIRNGLEAQYARFRDELGFSNLKVEQADKISNNGSVLNPMMLTFTNCIRLESDSFLAIP